MKMYIDQPLVSKEVFNPYNKLSPETIVDVFENLDAYEARLKAVSIRFKSERSDTTYSITIDTQKVCLDEGHMQDLMVDLNDMFDGLSISYSPMGYKGCDFCFRLRQDDH